MAYTFNPFVGNFDYYRTLSEATQQTFTGADLTGGEGERNRTLTTTGVGLVWVDNQLLHLTKDYTVSGVIITFLNEIWNDQPISVLN